MVSFSNVDSWFTFGGAILKIKQQKKKLSSTKRCLHTPMFALLNYNRITNNNKDYGGSHDSSLSVLLLLLQSRLEHTLCPHSLFAPQLAKLIVRVTNRKRAISHMSPGPKQLDHSCHLRRAASLRPPGALLHQIRGDIWLTVSPHKPGCLLRNLLMARALTRSLLAKPQQFSSSITSLYL